LGSFSGPLNFLCICRFFLSLKVCFFAEVTGKRYGCVLQHEAAAIHEIPIVEDETGPACEAFAQGVGAREGLRRSTPPIYNGPDDGLFKLRGARDYGDAIVRDVMWPALDGWGKSSKRPSQDQ